MEKIIATTYQCGVMSSSLVNIIINQHSDKFTINELRTLPSELLALVLKVLPVNKQAAVTAEHITHDDSLTTYYNARIQSRNMLYGKTHHSSCFIRAVGDITLINNQIDTLHGFEDWLCYNKENMNISHYRAGWMKFERHQINNNEISKVLSYSSVKYEIPDKRHNRYRHEYIPIFDRKFGTRCRKRKR